MGPTAAEASTSPYSLVRDMNRTPLNDIHKSLGAKMVEFNGWEMPLRYTSITEEHAATRSRAGLFDLSHMGRLALRGKDAEAFLSRMTTARTDSLPVGKGKYSFICDPDGGVIDDIVFYRFKSFIGLVVNAGNREAVLDWLRGQKDPWEVEIQDLTFDLAMIAIQGPRSQSILQGITDIPLGDLPYYRARKARVAGVASTVSRTGYTGEDGFEVFTPADRSEGVWGLLHDRGVPEGLVPAGLAARDTLRLEAAMPLYGHELSREGNPLEAGLGKFVSLGKEFIGRDAILRAKEGGLSRKLVGLEVEGKRIPRQGATVHRDGTPVGVVTSGTFSPSLQKTIALAYVTTNTTPEFQIDIRGKMQGARLTAIPFYKREG